MGVGVRFWAAVVWCGLGLAVVTVGIEMIYRPAAVIVCGVAMVAAGALLVNVDSK